MARISLVSMMAMFPRGGKSGKHRDSNERNVKKNPKQYLSVDELAGHP